MTRVETQEAEAPSFAAHPSRDEQLALGKSLRERCPRETHSQWTPAPDRMEPLDCIEVAEKGRLPELLALRHGRMLNSPFTFFRGSAFSMAADLAETPSTGIRVQCCGDAHLLNFGGFATPERRIIFSLNDLDETHPAPWEWDVKRLASSFVLASRDNGLSESVARETARISVRTYRKQMAEYSQMKTLQLWYSSLDLEEMISKLPEDLRRRGTKRLKKERERTVAEDIFPKLAEVSGDSSFIRDQLPSIFHLGEHPAGEVNQIIKDAFAIYRQSLTPAYQRLLDRFEIKDAAIKVVGIGSVGTRCWIVLLRAEEDDFLFLQVKEARGSVLEPYTRPSLFSNHGERVVNGYRLMQPFSDIFLGWTKGALGPQYFVRQLKDVKISMRVEAFREKEMRLYARWCGQSLALSHARSGNSATLRGYMGNAETFDQAVADFAVAYADQTHGDFMVLQEAASEGRLEVQTEDK